MRVRRSILPLSRTIWLHFPRQTMFSLSWSIWDTWDTIIRQKKYLSPTQRLHPNSATLLNLPDGIILQPKDLARVFSIDNNGGSNLLNRRISSFRLQKHCHINRQMDHIFFYQHILCIQDIGLSNLSFELRLEFIQR